MTTALKASPSWGRRIVGIEGLRGVAATAVVITHVGSELAPHAALGHLPGVAFARHGLTLFFALSGFLLYRPAAAAIITDASSPPVGQFLINRVLRIYPAYIVVLAIVSWGFSLAVNPPAGAYPSSATAGSLQPVTFMIDASLAHTIFPTYFHTGLTVSWSLTVEFVFYLLLPLLIFVASGLARRANRCAAACAPAAVILGIGVIGKLWFGQTVASLPYGRYYELNWGSNPTAVIAHSFLVQGDLFAYGMVAAVIVELVVSGRIPTLVLRWIRPGLVTAAGVLAVAALNRPGPGFADSFVGVACAAVLLLVAIPTRGGGHSLTARVLDSVPARFTGLVSYSMYLWHLPIIWWLQRHAITLSDTVAGFVVNLAVVLVITLGLAAATYWLVEAPALRLKQRLVRRIGTATVKERRRAARFLALRSEPGSAGSDSRR